MNWLMAHRVAAIKAAHIHRDHGVDTSRYVDVFAVLHTAGLQVMLQCMPRLFGVYVPGPRVGGVLLNAGLEDSALRHTAAHELGHHVFGHEICLDDAIDPLAEWGHASWPTEEKQAEAFAAWFLMPIAAVRTVLGYLGLDRPAGAEDAYQVAVHLGTSYRGTVRHLTHLRMVSTADARNWAKTRPKALRAQAAAGSAAPPTRVWSLDKHSNGAPLCVRAGDQLAVRLPGAPSLHDFSLPPGVVGVDDGAAAATAVPDIAVTPSTENPVVLTITPDVEPGARIRVALGGSAEWAVNLDPLPRIPRGLQLPPAIAPNA